MSLILRAGSIVRSNSLFVRRLCSAILCLAYSLAYVPGFSLFVSCFLSKNEYFLRFADLRDLLGGAHANSTLGSRHQGNFSPAQVELPTECTISLCATQLDNGFVNFETSF